MENFRLRMVFLGLVLGVLIAVVVASQGCTTTHHRRTFHGGAAPVHRVVRVAAVAREHFRPRVRRAFDANGPFFGYRRGRMSRVDAPRARREVALTFDDGPGPFTLPLLRELRRLHARATFFVVGSMAAIRPWDVRAEHRAGMEIGNHTWSHPSMTSLRPRAQRLEIERTNLLLRRLTGRRPRFFRPPDWHANARTARVVTRERMVGVLRTIDTRDWTLPGVRTIVRRALSVRPGGIVAMHDAGGFTRAQTVAAVPHIVRGLRRRHLRLVTIATLFDGR